MNKTEIKMLELAAKAANIEGDWIGPSTMSEYYKLPTEGLITKSEGRVHVWNPLTSCGDALRLVVLLRLNIQQITLPHISGVQVFDGIHPAIFEPYSSDVTDAATLRLAVTRFAAEIGKEMK